jgi:hypothetical protein
VQCLGGRDLGSLSLVIGEAGLVDLLVTDWRGNENNALCLCYPSINLFLKLMKIKMEERLVNDGFMMMVKIDCCVLLTYLFVYHGKHIYISALLPSCLFTISHPISALSQLPVLSSKCAIIAPRIAFVCTGRLAVFDWHEYNNVLYPTLPQTSQCASCN